MANTPTLQDLIGQLPGLLGQAISSPAEQQTSINDIMAANAPEALRKYGTTAQQIAESNFGRGMGLSSYNAYQQALNTLMQQEGMNKMQLDAKNQVDAAQRAAVGNAVNYATSEKNRAMQARQIDAQKSTQLRGALIGGLGNLGAGTAGVLSRDLMRPEGQPSSVGRAYDRLKAGMGFGKPGAPDLKTPGEGMGGTFEGEGQGPTSAPYEFSNTSPYPSNLSLSGPDSYNFGNSSAGYNFNVPDIQMPDFSLEGLFNGYSPEDFFNPALF